MNSMNRVLKTLASSQKALSAEEIGKQCYIRDNTVVKNIHYLRKEGFTIPGKLISGKNRIGEPVKYMIYWMPFKSPRKNYSGSYSICR